MRFRNLVTNLTFWVLLAILTGALLGHFSPQTGIAMQPLGRWFIELVKLFILPIIFLTITLGVSGMSDLRKVGRVGGKALLYFEVVTTFALLLGILVAWVIRPGEGVDTSRVGGADISAYRNGAEAFTWWGFFRDNTTIQVLILSILFGVLLGRLRAKARILSLLEKASHVVFRGLHLAMLLAPLGAFGGMAYTIGKYGLAALVPLAKLMLTVYVTMGLFIFLVLGWILRYHRIRISRFLNYIKEELLIVLGTSSSEAALPSLMEKLERMGCAKPVVGLVVPAGYSFNLDGTTIYLSMAVIFLAQVFRVELGLGEVLTMIGVLMVTSKGAAGVTGSGFIVLASTLSAIPVIPLEGLTLLLGVDRFMSEARAITNFIGNGVAAVFIANHEKAFDRNQMEDAFANEVYEYESYR